METHDRIHTGVEGRFKVRARNRDTGEWRDVGESKNAVNKQLMVQMLLDTESDRLTSSSELQIKNTGGTIIITGDSTDGAYNADYGTTSSGPTVSPSAHTLTLVWLDDSGSTLTDAYELEVLLPDHQIFSNTNNENLGNKASNEDWEYTYTLTFSSSSPMVTDTTSGVGINWLLENLAGQVTPPTLTNVQTDLHVRDTTGTPTSEVNSTSTYPKINGTNDGILFSFTSTAGNNTQDWDQQWIRHNLMSGTEALWKRTTSEGAKGAGEEWVYTTEWTF